MMKISSAVLILMLLSSPLKAQSIIYQNVDGSGAEETCICVFDYLMQQDESDAVFRFGHGVTGRAYFAMEVGWRKTEFGLVKESGLILGTKTGIRFFLNHSVSIDTSISFSFSTEDVFFSDYRNTEKSMLPGIRLKAWF